jgi:hypothetical protein
MLICQTIKNSAQFPLSLRLYVMNVGCVEETKVNGTVQFHTNTRQNITWSKYYMVQEIKLTLEYLIGTPVPNRPRRLS